MKKAEILNTAKFANQNKDIKWTVLENTKDRISLGNSYDKNVRFEILLHHGAEGKDIKMVDTFGWKPEVGYLLYGSEWYTDFIEEAEGIKMAIIKVVGFFYYYY